MTGHIDWVGCAVSLAALVLVGRKHWSGWIFSAVSQLVFLWINWHMGLYGLVPMSVISFCISVYNAAKWKEAL